MVSSSRSLISLAAQIPPPGIRTSKRQTSGGCWTAASTASSALPPSAQMFSPPASSAALTPARTAGWSSASSTVSGPDAGPVERGGLLSLTSGLCASMGGNAPEIGQFYGWEVNGLPRTDAMAFDGWSTSAAAQGWKPTPCSQARSPKWGYLGALACASGRRVLPPAARARAVLRLPHRVGPELLGGLERPRAEQPVGVRTRRRLAEFVERRAAVGVAHGVLEPFDDRVAHPTAADHERHRVDPADRARDPAGRQRTAQQHG